VPVLDRIRKNLSIFEMSKPLSSSTRSRYTGLEIRKRLEPRSDITAGQHRAGKTQECHRRKRCSTNAIWRYCVYRTTLQRIRRHDYQRQSARAGRQHRFPHRRRLDVWIPEMTPTQGDKIRNARFVSTRMLSHRRGGAGSVR